MKPTILDKARLKRPAKVRKPETLELRAIRILGFEVMERISQYHANTWPYLTSGADREFQNLLALAMCPREILTPKHQEWQDQMMTEN